MEKYLSLIMITAPGFIARGVARYLGDKPSKGGEFEAVLIYFLYSLGTLILTFLFAWKLNLFSITEPWTEFEKNLASPWFCTKFLLLSITCSIFIGTAWVLVFDTTITNFFNYLNRKMGRNEIYTEGSMLHKLFDDDNNHFLVIEKGDKEIAAGFFCGVSSPMSDRIEIFVSMHPEIQKKYELCREQGPHHPINMVNGTYIDLTNNVVIKELGYPLEWI